jgi:hypothetical protein
VSVTVTAFAKSSVARGAEGTLGNDKAAADAYWALIKQRQEEAKEVQAKREEAAAAAAAAAAEARRRQRHHEGKTGKDGEETAEAEDGQLGLKAQQRGGRQGFKYVSESQSLRVYLVIELHSNISLLSRCASTRV